MDWGIAHNFASLGDARERITLLRKNVLDAVSFKVDVSVAFNFSYCVFKTRAEMLAYCKAARAGLGPKGAFFLDIHGGIENTSRLSEETAHGAFNYVWDQAPFDAINGTAMRYIHFRFKDGSEIRRAFTYDWRLWTVPELRDILMDAGFKRVDVYWEGADAKGEGNGIFRRAAKAEQEEGWIAYVVAWR
jgi:hypothetical protein